MPTCPRCRSDVDVANRFCNSCGESLPPPKAAIANDKNASQAFLKGDTALDRSVTTIDNSAHSTTSNDDHSTHQTKVTSDDHSVRMQDDHSVRKKTSVSITGANTVVLGSRPKAIARPCPFCGNDLNNRMSFTCITCSRDMCTLHASSQSGWCRECFDRAAKTAQSKPRDRRALVAVIGVTALVLVTVVAWLAGRGGQPPDVTQKGTIAVKGAASSDGAGAGTNAITEPRKPAHEVQQEETQKDKTGTAGADIAASSTAVESKKAQAQQEETNLGKDKIRGSSDEVALKTAPSGTREPMPNSPTAVPRFDPALYVNRGVFNQNGPAVLIVKSGDTIDVELTSELASAIGGTDGMFKPAFVRDFFARAQQNDTSVLGDLGLERSASLIILGAISATSSRQLVGGENIIKTEAVLSVRVFRPQEAFKSQGFTERATGVGFSETKSLQEARAAIIKKVVARLGKLSW